MRLPVSGAMAQLRPLTGLDEAAVAEIDLQTLHAVGEVLTRFGSVDAMQLPLTDIDRLCMEYHLRAFGDTVRGNAECAACGERISVSFRAADYLERLDSQVPAGVSRDDGWFELADEDVYFRVPTLGDVLEAANEPHAEDALLRRCTRTEQLPEGAGERVQQALESISPMMIGPISGKCPACGRDVDLQFDPASFVLSEVCDRARFVFEEVDVLASRYHWHEGEVLALTTERRRAYVDAARRAGA